MRGRQTARLSEIRTVKNRPFRRWTFGIMGASLYGNEIRVCRRPCAVACHHRIEDEISSRAYLIIGAIQPLLCLTWAVGCISARPFASLKAGLPVVPQLRRNINGFTLC